MRSGQRPDEDLCPNCRLPMVTSPRYCRHCGIPSGGSSTRIAAGSDDAERFDGSGRRADGDHAPAVRQPPTSNERVGENDDVPPHRASSSRWAESDEGESDEENELKSVAAHSDRLVVPLGYWLLCGPLLVVSTIQVAGVAAGLLRAIMYRPYELRFARASDAGFVVCLGVPILVGCAIGIVTSGKLLWTTSISYIRFRREQTERRRTLTSRRAADESAAPRASCPD